MAHKGPWQANVVTLFPDAFPGMLGQSLAGRALEQDIWSLDVVQLRDFAHGKHRLVDDAPFGGGAGMVLRADVVADALASLSSAPGPRLYLSPRGRLLDQALVHELADGPGAVFVCGRYEGLDQRAIDECQLIELSVGDYILSGGELAAQLVIDACVRLLPGVMGKAESHQQESFETGLLEYPLYTQPRSWKGRDVPDVLTSGHHRQIAEWRQAAAEAITRQRRPDLWQAWQAKMAKAGKAKKQD